ncbi:MAG: 4-phosphoerythronate dehydrogenase [Mucinivorans sp.]
MKIVIDSAIPYITGVMEPYFDEVVYAGAQSIDRALIHSASALVVRTRTRCDRALLHQSQVEIIATATIGTDHIDADYCAQNSIECCSSAGCNARAVAQWVGAVLARLNVGGTLGIIGVGHVGQEVEAMAAARGFNILRCDPPRARREGSAAFVNLEELLKKSDAITLHVPLLASTANMVDSNFLHTLRPGAVLLNSSRGEVVDESALMAFDGRFALDVWRNEPHIDQALLARAAIATPHVAGYSARGKARATQMCVEAVGRHFGINPLQEWRPTGNFPLEEPEQYDVMIDDLALRSAVADFEALRRIR